MSNRGYGPSQDVIQPLVGVAYVAADLVVESDGGQVSVAGIKGTEMPVAILAVEVAMIFPLSRQQKTEKKRIFPFQKWTDGWETHR